MANNRKCVQLPSPVYTKLADLDNKERQIVNIFGIVKFFKSPCKTKGRDLCLTLSLVDDSYQNTDESFVCNIFCSNDNELPVVKSVGDILRLNGVKVSRFRGELQGKGTSSLSWVLFDGHNDDPSEYAASSIPNYTPTGQDKTILHDLKSWQSSFESIQPHFYKKILSQLNQDVVFFNIACQVVCVCQAVNFCIILTVWDGTIPACQSYRLEEPLKSTLKADDSMKHEGMTIDVFLYDEHATGEINDLLPGDFVLLNNIHAKPENVSSKEGDLPVMSFVIHKGRVNGRGVFKLQQDSYLAKELKGQIQLFNTKKPSKPMFTPREENTARTMQTSCTVTDFPLTPFTNIANIKKCSQIPNKFKCRVKALAFLPYNVKDFVQQCCRTCRQVSVHKEPKIDDKCKKRLWESDIESMDSKSESSQDEQETADIPKSNMESSLSNFDLKPQCCTCNQMSQVFVFSLLLEDITGVIHVMVFDEDARHFLPELPSPEDFLVQPDTQKRVHDSLISITDNFNNELSTDSEPFSNRPWMECCVMSYQVQGRGTFYRLFGTTVV